MCFTVQTFYGTLNDVQLLELQLVISSFVLLPNFLQLLLTLELLSFKQVEQEQVAIL